MDAADREICFDVFLLLGDLACAASCEVARVSGCGSSMCCSSTIDVLPVIEGSTPFAFAYQTDSEVIPQPTLVTTCS